MDGTLIDSRLDVTAAVNHVLERMGRPRVPVETVVACVGDGVGMLLTRVLGAIPDREYGRRLDEFLEYYGAHCLDDTRLYPGVREVLETLVARGRTLSVVTNKPASLAESILTGLGIRPFLVTIVGGDSLATRKPHPAGIHHVAALAGVDPADTLLVGDSPVDLETALAAGARFCGAGWGPAPERLVARVPDIVVRDVHDLLAVVERGASPSGVDSRGSSR